MKSTPSFLLFATLMPAALMLTSCSKSNDVKTAAESTQAAAKDLAAGVKTAVVDSWDNIKDYTYEKREAFAASLDRMADKHDGDFATLNAAVKGLPDDAAKQRDRAVKEYNESRAYLKAKLADVRASSAATWSDAREKAAEAWQRTHTAFEKVKSSPTS